MSYPGSPFKTWNVNDLLSSSDVNDSFTKVYTDLIPANIDNIAGGYTDVTAVGAQPTELGTEIKQLRSQIKEFATKVLGTTNWNEDFSAVSAATIRTTLGLEIGADVQAYSGDLAAISNINPVDGTFIVGDGAGWVAETLSTARTSLGAAASGSNADITSLSNLTAIGTVGSIGTISDMGTIADQLTVNYQSLSGSGDFGLQIFLDLENTGTIANTPGLQISPQLGASKVITNFSALAINNQAGSGSITNNYMVSLGTDYYDGTIGSGTPEYIHILLDGSPYKIEALPE